MGCESGLEPPTSGATNRRSDQLSYSHYEWLQGRGLNPHKTAYEAAALPVCHPASVRPAALQAALLLGGTKTVVIRGMVHEVRLELTSPSGHQVLSLTRIPVPPSVHMVRLEGIEPTTFGLRVRCSTS